MMEQAERFMIELAPARREKNALGSCSSAKNGSTRTSALVADWRVAGFRVLVGVGLLVILLAVLLPALEPVRGVPDLEVGGGRFHRVAEGDSLHDLSRRYYRDPSQWQRIFLANRNMLVRAGRLVPGASVFIPPVEVRGK